MGLGLGLRGPDLGLGLDNKYQVSVSVHYCAINNGSVASDWLSTEEMAHLRRQTEAPLGELGRGVRGPHLGL